MPEFENTSIELEPPSTNNLADACELNYSQRYLGLGYIPSTTTIRGPSYSKQDQLVADKSNKVLKS